MNITMTQQASERDVFIANNIMKQIDEMTLVGNGFTSRSAIPNGVQIDFHLSRPFGHRSIFITLNAWDMYEIKTVRYGKNFKEHVVAEHSDIMFDQLNDIIWGDISKSCGF